MKFSKWQGCGNDFIYIDARDIKIDYANFAKKYCDRHFGIGADGIVALENTDEADVRMRIINPDGTEPEMCGNGIRCFARAVYEYDVIKAGKNSRVTADANVASRSPTRGLASRRSVCTSASCASKEEFTVKTGAGILTPKIVFENDKITGVTVDMGKPRLNAGEIPVVGYGEGFVINKPIEVLGKNYNITCVSMGNPHAVVFVDDINKCEIENIGKYFESHSAFPRKTNTEFVEVLDRKHLRMRVWERGAAITLACGTGACASLVAAVLNDKADRKAKVILDGGELVIEWRDDDKIFMTGPAEFVFEGELYA